MEEFVRDFWADLELELARFSKLRKERIMWETPWNPRNHTAVISFVFHNANKCSTCNDQKGRIQSDALNRQGGVLKTH